jgi:hypothetical protein
MPNRITYSPIHQSRHNFVFFRNYCTGGTLKETGVRAPSRLNISNTVKTVLQTPTYFQGLKIRICTEKLKSAPDMPPFWSSLQLHGSYSIRNHWNISYLSGALWTAPGSSLVWHCLELNAFSLELLLQVLQTIFSTPVFLQIFVNAVMACSVNAKVMMFSFKNPELAINF